MTRRYVDMVAMQRTIQRKSPSAMDRVLSGMKGVHSRSRKGAGTHARPIVKQVPVAVKQVPGPDGLKRL